MNGPWIVVADDGHPVHHRTIGGPLLSAQAAVAWAVFGNDPSTHCMTGPYSARPATEEEIITYQQ